MNQEAPQEIISLAAGGFKDMSRIAKSSATMWAAIFQQNKTHTLNALYSFNTELTKAIHFLENEKHQELQQWMEQANELYNILE